MPIRTAVAATLLLAGGVALASCAAPGRPQPASERLPGAEEFSAELQARLQATLARRGGDYQPRTRHRRPDGTARYTNRLILEASPYLLQHAHNPVNWYPWGDEAFAHARAEGKPVLLSVGYSTCHWCHVMEEESFEDEEIAAYLNQQYVAIKVDREERPDIDDTYMNAVLVLTGNGGWPMTVWLTPERQPFFGGTYFPPRAGDRGAAVGFVSLLQQLRAAYDADPQRVTEQAAALTARVERLSHPPAGDTLPTATVMRAAFDQYAASFDAENGGFGRAPKFPQPGVLDFLLRYHRRGGDERALAMVTRTLESMAAGGIHDQIGGGFHRYATDAAWQVPHFEKMLYDNAQLAAAYLAAYQVTKRDDLARLAAEILDYVAREMTAPEGGFYAATDADSAGEEGRFFVWSAAEIGAVLTPAQAAAVRAYYGVTEPGGFAGRSTLHVTRPLELVARDLGTDPEELRTILGNARPLLYAARAQRVPPLTDTKILAAWNGLMISAFARGGAVLARPAYVESARAAATFVLERMHAVGRLRRSYADGAARQDGFLDDYAFVAAGLLDLYEATFELTWLREAIALHEVLDARFWDGEHGGFFMTADDHEVALGRTKPDDDGALPSGNAVAAENLLRLATFSGDDRWRRRAEETLRAFAPGLERAPTRAPRLLAVLDFVLDRPREIVIVRPERSGEEPGPPAGAPNERLLATVRASFVPNRMLTVATEGEDITRRQELIPLVGGKRALHGATTAYVCERGVCALPTSDPEVLARQLAKALPLP